MSLCMNRICIRAVLTAVVLVAPVLAACAKSERADKERIPVAVHGVNHTAHEFSFVIVDPLDEKNIAGGETINAFGAGGTMCCFNLPKQWRPGTKAQVKATLWLPRGPGESLSSLKKTYVIDVPAYQQGKAAELWILRTGDDEFSLVASNFQPDHPQWPGKIKGWPVPSMEYKRIIHAGLLKEAQSDVDLFESLLDGLKRHPVEHGKRVWEFRRINNANALKPYKGPADADFLTMLYEEYQTGLVEAREQLKRMKAAQP